VGECQKSAKPTVEIGFTGLEIDMPKGGLIELISFLRITQKNRKRRVLLKFRFPH
jgi:hypothetical protein